MQNNTKTRYYLLTSQDQRTESWLEVELGGETRNGKLLKGMKLWKESPGGTLRGKKMSYSWG